jgi:hypothetical protein
MKFIYIFLFVVNHHSSHSEEIFPCKSVESGFENIQNFDPLRHFLQEYTLRDEDAIVVCTPSALPCRSPVNLWNSLLLPLQQISCSKKIQAFLYGDVALGVRVV